MREISLERLIDMAFEIALPLLPIHMRMVARIVHRIIKDYLANPSLRESFGVVPVGAAPDDVKKILQAVFQAVVSRVQSSQPWLARIVAAFGTFFVTHLADAIWEAIFGERRTPLYASSVPGEADDAEADGGVAVPELPAGSTDELETACEQALTT